MSLPADCCLSLRRIYPSGKKGLITDVPGVLVGHVTHALGDVRTGVTAILPHSGNLFRDKVLAAAEVLNGFGKSTGLVQIRELGTIETPIMMTNTLSVGTVMTGLTRYMLAQNPDIGLTTGTVNCVVTECNDGGLNDIRGLHVTEPDVFDAIEAASDTFEEGAVGAGTGMQCLGFKGGIGSASRIVKLDGKDYTVGALVLSNFGSAGNLTVGGQRIGPERPSADRGSIIMVIACDIPLSERQLARLCRRAPIALGRTGSYMGNGSGDIAIAFTTANRVPHYPEHDILALHMVHDDAIDPFFEASAEALEESIISSLYHADTTVGRAGKTAVGLRDYLAGIDKRS